MTITITLSRQASELVQARIDSGEFNDPSAVIEAAIFDQQRDVEAIDQWMSEDVLPTLYANQADPNRSIGLDETLAHLRAHIDALGKAQAA
jgi:Arc/MetJ-type ribon-helix-helix transcriptional regulator